MVKILIVAAAAGCAAHASHTVAGRGPSEAEDDITMFRDGAIVRHRVDVQLTSGHANATVRTAAGVTADQIAVVETCGATVELHVVEPTDKTRREPTEVRIEVSAPHPGRYAIVIAYDTNRLRWDAAYTMTTTPARDRAVLSGARAIRNQTGQVLRGTGHVIDAELGPWRGHTAERLASSIAGATAGTTPTATPRDLGRLELGDTETRVELLSSARPQPMRSVLVYDPIGTGLDTASPTPNRERALGAVERVPGEVIESFEVARDLRATDGLPAGPVRLLERRPDGSLAVLGESRLFDVTTRVAEVDTIAVGSADRVVGHRVRREYTLDEDLRRLVEEFAITIDNERSNAASVLLREHLYRGQNWTLAYHSAASAAKEGPQQVALRIEAAPHARTEVMYVVVYTWP